MKLTYINPTAIKDNSISLNKIIGSSYLASIEYVDDEISKVKKSNGASIINIDSLDDIDEPEMDKLYQKQSDVLRSAMYLYVDGRIVKDEMLFGSDPEDGGLFLKAHDVTDWNDITPEPVLDADEENNKQTLNFYRYEDKYYYFQPLLTGNFASPSPDDIQLNGPNLISENTFTAIGYTAHTIDLINFCRQYEEPSRLQYIFPQDEISSVMPLMDVSFDFDGQYYDVSYSLDLDNDTIISSNDMFAELINYDGYAVYNGLILLNIEIAPIPMDMDMQINIYSPFDITNVDNGAAIFNFLGEITDSSSIVTGKPVEPGSTFYYDEDGNYDNYGAQLRNIAISTNSPNHTQVCMYEGYNRNDDTNEYELAESKPVYFYNLGHTSMQYGERTYEIDAYTVGFDYISANPVNLNNSLCVKEDAIEFISNGEFEMSSNPIIKVNDEDYYLAKLDTQRAIINENGEMLDNAQLSLLTDTHSIFEININEKIFVPVSLAGNLSINLPSEYGYNYVSYCDENGDYHEKQLDRVIYFDKKPDSDEYWFYEAIPQMWDLDDNPIINDQYPLNYNELWSNYMGLNASETYAVFSSVSYGDYIVKVVSDIVMGDKISAYVENAILVCRNITFEGVGESDLLYISNTENALEFDEYDLSNSRGNLKYPLNKFIISDNVSVYFIDDEVAYVWALRTPLVMNEMFMKSLDGYAKLMTTDDLQIASQEFVTIDNIGNYVKMNNFVYLDDDESFPEYDFIDHNKIYVRNNTYYHNSKYGGWNSFNSIIRIPSSYSSPMEYFQQNGTDESKLYLASVDYKNEYYDFHIYTKYNNSILKDECISANGDFYRPAFAYFAAYDRYSDRPIVSDGIKVTDYNFNKGYNFYVCRTGNRDNWWFDWYDFNDLNNIFGLFFSQSNDIHSFQRLRLNEYINGYDGYPKFLGFVPDSEERINEILNEVEDGFVISLPSYFLSQIKKLYRYDTNNGSLIEIGSNNSSKSNNGIEIIEEDSLPSEYIADPNKLYIYKLRGNDPGYGSTMRSRLLYGNIYTDGYNGISESLTDSYRNYTSVNIHNMPESYINEYNSVIAYPGDRNSYLSGDWMGLENYRYETNYDTGEKYCVCNLEISNIPEQDKYTINQVSLVFNPEIIYAYNNRHTIVINLDWVNEAYEKGLLQHKLIGWDKVATISNVSPDLPNTYEMYIALNGDSINIIDDIYCPGISIKWVNLSDGSEIIRYAEMSENIFMMFNGYVVTCDFCTDYEHPLVKVSSIDGKCFGVVSVSTSKYLSDSKEIYYHYTIGTHEFFNRNYESILLDSCIKDGTKLFTINGVDFYYYFAADPQYRNNPDACTTWYHIISATSDKSQIYADDYSFNQGITLGYTDVMLYTYPSNKSQYNRYSGNISNYDVNSYEYHIVSFSMSQPNEVGIDWDSKLYASFHTNSVIRGIITIQQPLLDPSEVNKYTTERYIGRSTAYIKLYPINSGNEDTNVICFLNDGKWNIINTKSLQKKIKVDDTLILDDTGLLKVDTSKFLKAEDLDKTKMYSHTVQVSTDDRIIRFTITTNRNTPYNGYNSVDREEISKYMAGKVAEVSANGQTTFYYISAVTTNKTVRMQNMTSSVDTFTFTFDFPGIASIADNM